MAKLEQKIERNTRSSNDERIRIKTRVRIQIKRGTEKKVREVRKGVQEKGWLEE